MCIEVHGIKYREIEHHYYKYQLTEEYSIQIPIYDSKVNEKYFALTELGKLTIKENYCWDGPSGPAPDLPCMMRASLVHDVLYQLMRERHLGLGWRKQADKLFRDICKKDGLNPLAADFAYWVLRKFGEFATRPE
ncbi:MAG: DUF1353 domain-containing protein [Desulfobacterales bacterium]|nr:DUF1353 domain-containing protein [Desulfobacterales bacterium]